MGMIVSPFVWYPDGYPGSGYDLRKILTWNQGPTPGTVAVRFIGTNTETTVIFNQVAFEAAMNGTSILPINTVTPVVSGTGYVDRVLTSSSGTWSGVPAPSFTYQWQRFTGSWTDIPLATNTTYTVLLADEGVPLRCAVTATNASGSVTAFSNTIEQFIPTDAPSVFAWQDAADPSTITHVANGVSVWADKSGAGHDMSQGTASRRPTTNAVTISGLNAIQGDADDILVWTTGGTIPADVDVHVFVLCNLASTDSSIYDYTSPGNTSRVVFNDDIVGRANGGPIITAGVTPTLPNGVDQIVYARQLNDGSNPEFRNYINGSSTTYSSSHSTAPIFVPGDTFNTTTIFDDTSGGDSWNGGIMGERVAIMGTLTTPDREKFEGYLAWRWQMVSVLPPSHPYKTVAPTP